jgi:hypothetical protein
VGLHSVLVRDLGHVVQLRHLPAGPAAPVRGLLDLDQSLRWRIARYRTDRGMQRGGAENPPLAWQATDHHAADRTRTTGLAGLDVRILMRQDFIARPAMRRDRDLVAHGTGRHEHRRLLAQQRRGPVAQIPHRGIRTALFVPAFRIHHRFLHGARWPGLGVGIQVDADGHGEIGPLRFVAHCDSLHTVERSYQKGHCLQSRSIRCYSFVRKGAG